MYKQHLLENMEREIALLKQLTPFIEEKDLAYKPVDNVRTTLELMQYLSTIGSYTLRWIVKNDITDEVRQQVKDYRSGLTIADFNERLDRQLNEVRTYMSEVSEDDLLNKTVTLPTRESMPMGQAIINAPIKWLAAYRMELFLYLKMNGHSTLGTKEAWIAPQVVAN